MTLKLIKPEDRIVFLKRFVEQLLVNSKAEEEKKKIVEIEKLKQKFIEPLESPEKAIEKAFLPSIQKKELRREIAYLKQNVPNINKILELKQKPAQIIKKRRPIFHRIKRSITPIRTQKQLLKPTIQPQIIQKNKPQLDVLREVQPIAQPKPQEFNLGKVEQLLKDKRIQSIECGGPGKNILVKKNSRINTTKISLNQQEITEVINEFSKQAKIPISGGILKAAVGDLVISAIISEFVGSRFIINRITGYARLK